MSRYTPKKTRTSTRDKFVSVLHQDSDTVSNSLPWYKRRSNFFPLVMIVVFSFLYMAAKVYLSVREELGEQPEEPLTYEEAKKIFNSPSSPQDESIQDESDPQSAR